MRTYAPATVDAVLDDLLAEPSIARGVVHHQLIPARAARTVPLPAWLDPRIRPGLERRGITELYIHQAEAIEAVHAGPGRGRRDPHRLGQVAVLHAPGPPGAGLRSVGPGPLPVPDQGPRPGPGCRVQHARPAVRTRRGGRHVRRRHAGADPLGDPDGRPGGRDQPGHAPRGDPAPSHEVVPALRAAPGDRGRRAPHLPGRLRQPRRQRPAPPPPAVRPLRLEAGDRVLLGHDRQPARACQHPDRTDAPARRPERRAGRRAPPPAGRPAAPRRRQRRRAARP